MRFIPLSIYKSIIIMTATAVCTGLVCFSSSVKAIYTEKRWVAKPFVPQGAFVPQMDSCAALIREQESAHKIPQDLLSSIALVESGRKSSSGRMVAWPWTVNSQRRGYVFATKEQAVAFVRQLQSRGINNINVGCMQINLKHHPKAFKSLEDAFDPKQNIAYGAALFKHLERRFGSWNVAIARYHTGSKRIGARYLKRVLNHWGKLNPRSTVLKETLYQPAPTRRIPAAILFAPSVGIKKKSYPYN